METIVSEDLLARYTLVDTRSPEEARQKIGQIFTPHFLLPRNSKAAGFHAVHRSVRHDFYSLNLVRYGCEVDIDPGELSRFFMLLFPIAGTGSVRCGKETAFVRPGQTAAILSPTLPARVRWSDGCETVVVLLEREALEQQWALMVDRPITPVEFATGIDVSRAAGRLLLNHVLLMLEGVETIDIPSRYRIRLGEGLMQLMLASFPHSQRPLLEKSSRSSTAGAIGRAEEWIRANISRPFSVAEIAAASATSLRALQDMLRRKKGTTLTEMIETIRLDAFRACLMNNSHSPKSVTECAFSVGLGHLGRAAIAYQKRYGETPSQTLRRRR